MRRLPAPFRALTVYALAVCFIGCQAHQDRLFPSGVATSAGPYSGVDWVGLGEGADFENFENEIKKANFEFYLDDEDELECVQGPPQRPFKLPNGGGEVTNSEWVFSGFVVVQLHKLAQLDEVNLRVSRLNDFFFAHGAERLLVTGFRGFGRTIYSDQVKESEQIASH